MRTSAVALAFLALASVATACSSKSDPAEPTDSGTSAVSTDSLIGCENMAGLDTYAPNLEKPGKSGVFNFTLVSSDPAPPGLNTNTWILKVADASGSPVDSATFLSITPFMPEHGHGSTATAVATSNGDGTYTITPLYLFMAGFWQITFAVESGTQKDTVQYSFCIAG